MNSRMDQLRDMLAKAPADAFLLYALALEHRKLSEYPAAIDLLTRTLVADPTYAAAAFQAGQVHQQTGDIDAARKAYADGIAIAEKNGDHHAADEMRAALEMIE